MPRPVRWIAPAIAILIGFVACGDPTIPPDGTPAEVLVRAYVDADGTGSMSPGDPAIAGVQVTLTPTEDGANLTATTDADGLARFSAVRPGSYVAALTGGVPAGAVVSGPARPVVVVPFQGGTVEAEFRYVFHPGGLSGVVFRDDDGSGSFNPDVDGRAPGADILVYQGTDMAADPVASVTTGSDGAFEVTPLRPGSYSVLVRVPEPLELVGDSVHLVEVPAAGMAELWPQFTGDLLISIEAARAAGAGATVTVQGVVLADQGTYDFGNRDTYIQDGTAGVRLWQLDTTLGLVAGDSVQVTGSLSVFRNELQLNVSDIERLGTGTVPAAVPVTGAQIQAFEHQGELASTGAVTVVSVQGFDFDAHNVTVEDQFGAQFLIRVDSPNEINTGYWQVGQVYRVRGVLARFFDDGQIKPRGFDDVMEVASLAEIRALSDGQQVLAEGVVLADQGTYDFQNRDTYIQDPTAGIKVFYLPTDLGLEVGDSVRVWGRTATFNNERQIEVAGIEVLGIGAVPAPVEVTGAIVNSFEYDGQLGVTVPVTVVSVAGFSFDAHNVTVEDGDGTRFLIRVDSPNEITTGYWVVGGSYRVTGVVARFRQDGQIKPRGYADVEEL
jgi:DNA/RNA endonuclease YhcR with UshA esterase domain